MGACPTATPFRRRSELIPGIELPQASAQALRQDLEARTSGLDGESGVVVFGCAHGPKVERLDLPNVASVALPCIAALPPSYIDYALSRGFAAGVFLAGCHKGDCYHRFGVAWMEERLAGERDPALRRRVPRERIGQAWLAEDRLADLTKAIESFQAGLPPQPASTGTAPTRERHEAEVGSHA